MGGGEVNARVPQPVARLTHRDERVPLVQPRAHPHEPRADGSEADGETKEPAGGARGVRQTDEAATRRLPPPESQTHWLLSRESFFVRLSHRPQQEKANAMIAKTIVPVTSGVGKAPIAADRAQ